MPENRANTDTDEGYSVLELCTLSEGPERSGWCILEISVENYDAFREACPKRRADLESFGRVLLQGNGNPPDEDLILDLIEEVS